MDADDNIFNLMKEEIAKAKNEENSAASVAESPVTAPAILQKPRLTFGRVLTAFFLIIILSCLFSLAFLFAAPALRDWTMALKRPFIEWQQPVQSSSKGIRPELKNLERRLAKLQKMLGRMIPQSPYLIVDTSDNNFFLMKGDAVMRKGACSTGSYTLLKTENNKQQWIFKTPRGMFRIQNKVPNPVWRMPDWAFVEEGRPVPRGDSPERYEYGVLGDYALAIGDGYLIHGTLYQRFLGLAVTHGCVRLGDDDLKTVYKTLQTGSKVFIY